MKLQIPPESAVMSWLEIHDPRHYGPGGIHTPEALSAMVAVAGPDSSMRALSGAVLTGPMELIPARLTLGSALAQHKLALKGLKENGPKDKDCAKDPLGGAISLSEMSRKSAGYNPQILDDNTSAAAFRRYQTSMGSCPLFAIKMSDAISFERHTSDWTGVIQDIAGMFTGIATEDNAKIVKSLKGLAEAAGSSKNTEEKANLFVQNALDVNGAITLYVYDSEIRFMWSKHKGFDSKQTRFRIVRLQLHFRTDLWPQYSARVKAAESSSVDDWLNNNSTIIPEGTPPIQAFLPST